MKKVQSGFTLIELVVVIVILGILAITAVPRVIDLQDEAKDAALQGVIGAVNAGSAINYAGAVAGDGTATAVDAGTSTCETIVPLLVPNIDWTNDYEAGTVGAGDQTIGADGDPVGTASTCTVTDRSDTSVTGSAQVINTAT